MSPLMWIILASVTVSLVSVIGIFALAMNKKFLEKILMLLVGFAAGGLMGGAFLHLLPEAAETWPGLGVFVYAMIGFSVFFLMERYFYWRHCHNGVCDVHAFTYMNLWGDGVHNFIDGMLIAASFITDIRLGVATTLAIIFHEIPQEIGDFGVLVYGGFSRKKALLFNFISALAAVAGAILGYFLVGFIGGFLKFLIPFTAGGFIYIAASDLIPELHKQSNNRRALVSFIFFLLGLLFMGLIKVLGE